MGKRENVVKEDICHMKLNEDLFWARVTEAINSKGEMSEFKNSDELTIKKLTYENKKLKEKVEDLEETLEIASALGSQFMKHFFMLLKLVRESGHSEIADKFMSQLNDELKKSMEKD